MAKYTRPATPLILTTSDILSLKLLRLKYRACWKLQST